MGAGWEGKARTAATRSGPRRCPRCQRPSARPCPRRRPTSRASACPRAGAAAGPVAQARGRGRGGAADRPGEGATPELKARPNHAPVSQITPTIPSAPAAPGASSAVRIGADKRIPDPRSGILARCLWSPRPQGEGDSRFQVVALGPFKKKQLDSVLRDPVPAASSCTFSAFTGGSCKICQLGFCGARGRGTTCTSAQNSGRRDLRANWETLFGCRCLRSPLVRKFGLDHPATPSSHQRPRAILRIMA